MLTAEFEDFQLLLYIVSVLTVPLWVLTFLFSPSAGCTSRMLTVPFLGVDAIVLGADSTALGADAIALVAEIHFLVM